jgi:DNA-3-methyladenine glycosylase II
MKFDGHRLHAFPSPKTLLKAEATALRAVGLSENKMKAILGCAQAVLDGAFDEDRFEAMQTPDVIETLTAHPGIGPRTATVIALRGLGRLDLFPLNDSGVARAIKLLADVAIADERELLAALGEQRGMLYYHLLLGRLVKRGEAVI